MEFVFLVLQWELRMGFPFMLLTFLVFSHTLLLYSAGQEHSCPSSMDCGNLVVPIKFPFTNNTYPQCGLYTIRCLEPVPSVVLGVEGRSCLVSAFTDDAIQIKDPVLERLITDENCDLSSYLNLATTPSISFTISPNLTLFKCISTPETDNYFLGNKTYRGCQGYTFYYTYGNHQVQLSAPRTYPGNCAFFQLPMVSSVEGRNLSNPFSLLASEFSIRYHVSDECHGCHENGGQCARNTPNFQCMTGKGRRNLVLILATVIPGVIILSCLLIIIWQRKKWRNYISSYTIWKNTSSDPSSKQDLEEGSVYFGVPVFSYSELKEATHNFDPLKELGDGGFGTVYYGKLRDGQEIAVKRLYEHNCKRVAQFMNEIEILMRLRHRCLVTFYGCSSRHSHELLLVYEYIPNGTVADHLHGDQAKDHPLTWPIRMNIAIETASALAYLHASDIIHRDVKTNNILLDNNFCVKVADFGLSRLFPNDVSHISTAPQGTPGYVDPEYHQCYQLTDRSDVYSFGVVLIELISSLPAVDINRLSHGINLATFAISRIKNGALNELVDLSLGIELDCSIKRMTTSVANVAFQCLELEREMRPRMDEVLEALKKIQEYEDVEIGKISPPSLDGDNVVLLNGSKVPPSPDSVTNRWVNSSTASVSSR